jgi:endonuclease/exonuclease/phosphatase family metal-dependent hydrolase
MQIKEALHTASLPGLATATPSPLHLRLITHNIRYAANWWSRFPHEPPWSPTRHALLARQLHFLTSSPSTSVIFLQEVLHNQFDDVSASLGEKWTGLGVGRDDGKLKGEFEGVWYQRDQWRRVAFETHWLNETGEVGRKGWDAASVRVVTCLVLELSGADDGVEAVEEVERSSKGARRVLFMNTHFDDQGKIARRESSKLILRILGDLKKKFKPDFWVVGGDLNSPQSDDAYEVLAAEYSGLVDVRSVVHASQRWGEEATYTGFDGKGDGSGPRTRIDFLFVPRAQEKSVVSYAVMPNTFEDSKEGRVSDHRAVVVDLVLD